MRQTIRDADASGDQTPLYLFRDARTGIVIREAVTTDVSTMAAIGSRAFHHAHQTMLHPVDLAGVSTRFDEASLRAAVDDQEKRLLVALWGGGLVGYSELAAERASPARESERTMRLEGVYVAPDWEGQGAGSALVSASVDLARTLARRRLTVRVFGANALAVEFLLSLGFTRAGEELVEGRGGRTSVVTLSREL